MQKGAVAERENNVSDEHMIATVEHGRVLARSIMRRPEESDGARECLHHWCVHLAIRRESIIAAQSARRYKYESDSRHTWQNTTGSHTQHNERRS